MDPTNPSLEDRLKITKFDRKACLAAMKGEEVPFALGDPVHRLCIIRGIRYHHKYGNELHGVLPAFTRALNARSIMSNVIPASFTSADEVPYCIWHPDIASEDTYREVAKNFPQMVSQVGRACAVAGYTQLYMELPILPDVHIAEEARECGNTAIFEKIMSQPVRHSIMNDYKLTIDLENRNSANLNGDTCVRWMLDIKQAVRNADTAYYVSDGKLKPKFGFHDYGYDKRLFDLTEDMHIDENESDKTVSRLFVDREEVRLVSEPLPLDLTTVQKDLLIIMAAYYGDVDRYARLRRPHFIAGEYGCCIRGIYHNTPFAIWWSKQPREGRHDDIEKAINARFIMNNVLSGAPFRSIPYLIWYPTQARPATYRHLALLQPSMLPQIMYACIIAGHEDLFNELLSKFNPDEAVIRAAELSLNKHFTEALLKHVQHTGIEPKAPPIYEGWKMHMSDSSAYFDSSDLVVKYLDSGAPANGFETPYNGRQCEIAEVETTLCLPEAWRIPADDERNWCTLDYEDWPPKVAGKYSGYSMEFRLE